MDILISILSLVGFVLLTASTGLFVAVEFALTGLERSTIDQDVHERGDKRSHAVKRDYQNLSFVLSGAQLGITVTTLATGFLAEPILAKFLHPILEWAGMRQDWSTPVALVLALIIATFLSMVFGELVPKNIAITDPLNTARFVVGPVHAFNFVFKGFIKILNRTANALVRKLGIEPADELATARSTQELTALVRNSAEQGGLDENTALVLDRSLRFGETTAEELMTPRSTIETLSHDDTVLDLIALAQETGHSRFPVIRGDLDDTIGVVHYKDAFAIDADKRGETKLSSIAREVKVIPESLDGDAVLSAVRTAGSQMILVADEYGGTAGIITIEDVVEEILGEVYDEHDDAEAERDFHRFGSSWEVSGLVRLDELEEKVGYVAPEGPYETLGGIVMATLGRIPVVNDLVLLPQSDNQTLAEFTTAITGRWQAKVASMEDRRVDKVILVPISDEEAEKLKPQAPAKENS
ncbi:hemolysin family protein [Corynebacterium felinum]|uniref:CBS domain containing-hemolysin-like protein n=1 Tax=Corynebacterium felinum TaxID=131318 RepID=A0ABU2BAF3_9CORY|nr:MULTISPECIES: hemolysin family protein [Corynebacterium]MDF5819681.1 hemolysin family protein [Corynebacterium felinum]MDO4762530.1 hemolysin family protein [Corynebacterium sp.]MDR7355602.1 CBS domain containing-hemolysin-like protein [Corynebacterium felinum]